MYGFAPEFAARAGGRALDRGSPRQSRWYTSPTPARGIVEGDPGVNRDTTVCPAAIHTRVGYRRGERYEGACT
jgi:hypothetical protein